MQLRIVFAQGGQRFDFPVQEPARQNRISQRIVLFAPRRFVVFLQGVVGIPRETQRRQFQRIDDRQLFQQHQLWKQLCQHRQVVTPEVVTRDRLRREQRVVQARLQQGVGLRLLPQPCHSPAQ